MERGRGRGRATKKGASVSSDPSHHHHHHHHPPPAASSPSTASSSQPLDLPSLQQAPADSVVLDTPGASLPQTHASRGGKLGSRGPHSAHRQRTASPSTSSDVNSRITPRSDRPARSATFNGSFPLEAPSGQSDTVPRKRARTSLWPEPDGPSDEGHSKGGHSLRKRARIDYTQEVIDFDYPSAGRPVPDQAAKSTATPAGRSRKRLSKPQPQGPRSGDDVASEGPSSSVRRRRPTQSPAPTRGSGSSRRRPPSRKSTTAEPTPFHVDQPSDNEVQDTILVGVSMDRINSDESEGSESFDENRSSTQDSDMGRALADDVLEPATPQPPAIPQVEQAVSVASENEGAIQSDLVGGQKIESEDAPPKDIHLGQLSDQATAAFCEATSVVASPGQVNSDEMSDQPANNNQQPSLNIIETETASVIFQAESVAELDPKLHTTPPVSNLAPLPHENPNADNSSPHNPDSAPGEFPTMDSPPPQSPPPKITPPSPSSPIRDTKLAKAPLSPEDRDSTASTTQTVSRGWGRLRRAPRSHEPSRLKEVEKVYQTATPFATALGLSPYVEEDVLYPGPFSESIQREDISKSEATPMPTPAPTPPPPEARPGEMTWDGCTPLSVSQFYQLWKQEENRCAAIGQPQPTWKEFHNCCARRLKAAQGETKMEKGATPVSKAARMGPKAAAKQRPALVATASFEDTPQGSQAADSEAPTAAPSPAAAIDEDPDVDAEGEDDLDVEEADPLPKTTMTEPVEVTRNPSTQYRFPKLRDAQEFVDSLKDPDSLTKDQLYERTAAAIETMQSWQQEYNELKKMVDDEENSKRRVAHDKTLVNWENRQKADEPTLFRRHFDEPVKGYPSFEVRGARAPAPYIDDPVLERQKQEDKIMAQSHGFKYNSHPALVGRQNPEEQRWEMPENRLRERRRTEKGAELAEEGGDGKRARRMPRNLSDQSKDPSRAGTPIAIGSGFRGKRKFPGSFNEDDADEAAPTETAPAFKPTARGRGGGRGRGRGGRGSRGGRGGRGGSTSAQQRENFRTPSAERDSEQTDGEFIEKPTPARKRAARGSTMHQSPAAVLPGSPEAKSAHHRTTKPTAGAEIPTSSFYSNYASVDSQADSRPSTASSAITETAENNEATYSLREKRKRNFVLENDPVLEPRSNKRARGAAAPKRETLEPKKKSPKRKGATTRPAAQLAQAPVPPTQLVPVATHVPAPAHPPSGGLKAPAMIFNPPALAPTQAPHGPFMHTFSSVPTHQPGVPQQAPPPAIAPAAKKPITKIRITNNGSTSQASSRAVTPATIAPNPSKLSAKTSRPSKAGAGDKASAATGAAPGEEKSYDEMSKSEKMSYSMKRRWAMGEMQGAVEKRRNTLANKKAEKAANSANGSGNDANPRSASASVSGTPTPVPVPNPFGMPPHTHNPATMQQQPLQYPHGGLIPPPGVAYFPSGGGPAV